MILTRRKFFVGLGALFAAPAIIPYERLMPVKTIIVPKFFVRYYAKELLVYQSIAFDDSILDFQIPTLGVPLTSGITDVKLVRA